MINILLVIAARGGSKGVLRKNIKDLSGLPLFLHITNTLFLAQKEFNDGNIDIILSSDDDEIIKYANEHTPKLAPFKRPSELALDSSPSIDAVLHALKWMEINKNKSYTHIGLVQPTSPLINKDDILGILNMLSSKKEDFNSWTTVTKSSVHPFKMKRMLDNGRIINYIDQGFEDMRARQLLPPVYKRSGAIYITKTTLAVNNNSIINEPCFGYEVPSNRGVDIDSELDFRLVELLINEEKND